MATQALGSTCNDLAHYQAINGGWLLHHYDQAQRTCHESDHSQSTRYFPSEFISLIPSRPVVMKLEFPAQSLVESFQRGEHAHFDFNDRNRLNQPFEAGMASLRGVGYLNALWNKEHLLREIAQIFKNRQDKSPVVIAAYLGGGTGSSALFSLLEAIDHYVQQCGAAFTPEIHVVAMVHAVGAFDPLTEVRLANEAAASAELFALQAGGACSPEVSRKGWNEPRRFGGRIHCWLIQDPGDRHLSQQQFVATAAAIMHLLFEHPTCSSAFHRDAVDRYNNPQDPLPLAHSFGFSRIYQPVSERETYFKTRLLKEVIEEALSRRENPDREAKSFIRQNKIAEDGRNLGLSQRIRERAFQGESPIREKLTQTRPSGVFVPGALKSVAQ
ncbi:MAG: hypothetical protein KC964_28345, partial [Candidatus Omnitrophica bacterium]|nr:hypothetical protein [Candidatus Omnitrophota bacterium]